MSSSASVTSALTDNTSVPGRTVSTGVSSNRSGRFQGRGRHQGRGGGTRQRSTDSIDTVRFKGATDAMNGNVFECYNEQSDRRQYAKAIEALEGYIKKNLVFSEDLASLFAPTPALPVLARPAGLPAGHDDTDEFIWKEELKEFVKRRRTLVGNLSSVYAVVWGQCSEAMKAKIKSSDEYEVRSLNNDCHWLLREIRSVTLQFDQKSISYISLLDARASFHKCRQRQGQSATSYLEEMRGWVDTIEYHGGTVGESYTLVNENDDDGNARTEDERTALARDRTLGIALLRGADPTRYGTLIADLSNQYAMGHNSYPSDMTSAYSLLVNYKTPTNAAVTRRSHNASDVSSVASPISSVSPSTSGVTFAQQQKSTPVPGSDGVLHPTITCYQCHGTGHYANTCPAPLDNATTVPPGTTLFQYVLAQTTADGIHPRCILLDSQSTISVFMNPSMLSNIRPSPQPLRAITNGGHQDSTMIGDFPILGPV
jgi:hypothetical protein